MSEPVSPTTPPAPAPARTKPLPTLLSELWDLTVAYLKQETVDPIKGIGRYVAFGLAGSALLSIGLVLLIVAALRLLQTETGDVFDDDWTWAPYFIVLAGCAIVVALCARGIRRSRGAKKGQV